VPKKHENAQTAATASYEKSDEDELFAFTSTLTYSTLTDKLSMPKSRFGACINSGASQHYCPDHSKFENYVPITGCDIIAADGRMLKAVGVGDIQIDLLNSNGKTKVLLKDAIYALDIVFALISISQLDHANCTVTFCKGICTIRGPDG